MAIPTMISAFLLALLLPSAVLGFSLPNADCADVVSSSSPFTGTCTATWSALKPSLKPTQKNVGYAWIKYKVNKDFTSKKSAQKELDSSPTPAVLGPADSLYIVDDHHTLCALDYSEYSDVIVTVNVLCDLRHLSTKDFWATLASQNLVYLAAHPTGKPDALPVAIKPADLPSSVSFTGPESSFSFPNDPWRSIAGFARKVQVSVSPVPSCSDSDYKYCMRCMYRGCGNGSSSTGPAVDYFEFQWAYFLNDATFFTPSWWPTTAEHTDFKNLYQRLSQGSMADIDTDAWLTAAAHAIVLCRADSTADYKVPSFFPGDGKLPGYVQGFEKLSEDPTCDAPDCHGAPRVAIEVV